MSHPCAIVNSHLVRDFILRPLVRGAVLRTVFSRYLSARCLGSRNSLIYQCLILRHRAAAELLLENGRDETKPVRADVKRAFGQSLSGRCLRRAKHLPSIPAWAHSRPGSSGPAANPSPSTLRKNPVGANRAAGDRATRFLASPSSSRLFPEESAKPEISTESLILAQDERWWRA